MTEHVHEDKKAWELLTVNQSDMGKSASQIRAHVLTRVDVWAEPRVLGVGLLHNLLS